MSDDERQAKPKLRPGVTDGDDDGNTGVGGVGRWSWLFLVAAIVALAFGSWTLLVAILGLALLILVHEFGHFLAAKAFGMRVERFYIGFPPAAVKHTRGDTEYGIGLIPLGGFCKISGMTPEEDLPSEVVPKAYYSKPVWQRNVTIIAGPFMNIVAAVVILFVFVLAQGVAKPTLAISTVQSKTPAATAGLHAGDVLVAADGVVFHSWDQAQQFFRDHPNARVQLTYKPAGGTARTIPVDLTVNSQNTSWGFLGVAPGMTYVRPNPLRAGWLALTGTRDVFSATFKGFAMLFSGKVNPAGPDGAVGPVGIVGVSVQAVRQDWYPLLLAFISVNLGIMNLLPILPFDGGHVVLNLAEKLRGHRISPKIIERLVAVGVALLVTLFVLLTWNDIHRLLS